MKLNKSLKQFLAVGLLAILPFGFSYTADAATKDKTDEQQIDFGFKRPEPQSPSFFDKDTASKPQPAAPAAQPEKTAPAGGASQGKAITSEEAAAIAKTQGYKHSSRRYGYSIVCPQKPNVIPLSLIDEKEKGEVLIFENDDFFIKRAWVIMCDAFEDKEVPTNLATMSEQEKKNVIEHLMKSAGYEFVRIADMGFTHGIYCVTAKEVMVDENGDGKPDYKMTADNQTIKTFFRGQHGGHFSVQLLNNPDLTEEGISAFQIGLLTFEELPPEGSAPKAASAGK